MDVASVSTDKEVVHYFCLELLLPIMLLRGPSDQEQHEGIHTLLWVTALEQHHSLGNEAKVSLVARLARKGQL